VAPPADLSATIDPTLGLLSPLTATDLARPPPRLLTDLVVATRRVVACRAKHDDVHTGWWGRKQRRRRARGGLYNGDAPVREHRDDRNQQRKSKAMHGKSPVVSKDQSLVTRLNDTILYIESKGVGMAQNRR